jgi:hypothetical protein
VWNIRTISLISISLSTMWFDDTLPNPCSRSNFSQLGSPTLNQRAYGIPLITAIALEWFKHSKDKDSFFSWTYPKKHYLLLAAILQASEKPDRIEPIPHKGKAKRIADPTLTNHCSFDWHVLIDSLGCFSQLELNFLLFSMNYSKTQE